MYPLMEHDACGIGTIVNIDGRQDRRSVKQQKRQELNFEFPEKRDGILRRTWLGNAQTARQAIMESACFSFLRIT